MRAKLRLIATTMLLLAAGAVSWGEELASVYSDDVAASVCRTRCEASGVADPQQCLASCLGRASAAPAAPLPAPPPAVPPPDADTLHELAMARQPIFVAAADEPPELVDPSFYAPPQSILLPPTFVPLRVYHTRRRIRHRARPPAQSRPAATASAPPSTAGSQGPTTR